MAAELRDATGRQQCRVHRTCCLSTRRRSNGGAIGPAPITVSTVKHRLIRFRLSGARLRYVYHLAGNTERY
jgi:hypothetical protein